MSRFVNVALFGTLVLALQAAVGLAYDNHSKRNDEQNQAKPIKSQGIRTQDIAPQGTVTKPTPVVRDHRNPVVVRDHRTPVVVRDHRDPVVVRDHRTPIVVRDHRTPVVVRDHRDPIVVRDHRDGVVVRDHRAPVIVRDHRDPVVVRDHRTPVVVRDHRQSTVVVGKPRPATEVTIGNIKWPARPVVSTREPVRLPPAIIGKPRPWSDDASQASGGVLVQ
jgi:hypothetical protein